MAVKWHEWRVVVARVEDDRTAARAAHDAALASLGVAAEHLTALGRMLAGDPSATAQLHALATALSAATRELRPPQDEGR